MDINCSDYLFVQKHADFFMYDKKSAYLYPIDSLHFEIGKAIKEAFRRDGTILDIKYFIQNIKGYESNIIQDHYDFIISIFLEKEQVYSSNTVISLEDIENSIAIIPHIVVEVTEKCNFRCDYCCYGDMYDTQSEGKERINDMPEEDFMKCFRQLLSNRNILLNNKLVISFYGGEPFLNFRLIKTIVELCEGEFPEIEFHFRTTTNGSFLKNHLEFLIK